MKFKIKKSPDLSIRALEVRYILQGEVGALLGCTYIQCNLSATIVKTVLFLQRRLILKVFFEFDSLPVQSYVYLNCLMAGSFI